MLVDGHERHGLNSMALLYWVMVSQRMYDCISDTLY